MSNLHPGGQRVALHSRIFGFENIRAFIRGRKGDHARNAENSIAKRNRRTGAPHEHKREIARRRRQAERGASK